MPICEGVLENLNLSVNDLDGFAVSKGPGSYTGLRIGISAVKAICYASGKKCLGVSSLESLAYNFLGAFDGDIAVVMKARADLVYFANFSSKDGKIERISSDEIIPIGKAVEIVSKIEEKMFVAGDFAEEFCNLTEICSKENIRLAPPSLRCHKASSLCYAAFAKGELECPTLLNAEYLQITKAEKDLENT